MKNCHRCILLRRCFRLLERSPSTYDDSVVDGVNVPPRVYRIITDITAHGGTIEKGTKITETSKRTGKSEIIDAGTSVEYGASELDRSVVNKKQIKEVLMA